MHQIIKSLIQLSEAASSALPLLQSHDYRKEVEHLEEQGLHLDMVPKTIRDIINGILIYCIPIIDEENNLPLDALLTADNMKNFTDNLNTNTDIELAHRISFIKTEPIKSVSEEFNEIGLNTQARLLENVYNFALAIKQSHNNAALCRQSNNIPPVQYLINLAPEELNK